MEFLVFLAAYILRRRLDQSERLSADGLWQRIFSRYDRVAGRQESGFGRGLLLIGLPVFVVGLGEFLLREMGWSLAVHPLALLLLVILMGTPGLGGMLDAYIRAWRRGDLQAAWRHLDGFLSAAEQSAATSPQRMHLVVCRMLILRFFERYFVIAFWYLLAGAAGALAAAGVTALRDHWPHASARQGYARLVNGLDYIPARLLGLSFGIAGDLAGWLKDGLSALMLPWKENAQSLARAANAALTGYELQPERFSELAPGEWPDFAERSLAAIRGLLNRSMLAWICLLALLVIAGIV